VDGSVSSLVLVRIDIGTTIVRAVAFDGTEEVVDQGRRATGFEIPKPGWAETDMDGLSDVAARDLREMAAAVNGSLRSIRALSVCG
jgi:sugar (pentulose or hexulose) kinase